MQALLRNLRVQALIIVAACVSMTALAGFLIQDALGSAAQRLLWEAGQQCQAASRELREQWRDQLSFREEEADSLPFAARDLSLRGLVQTVLRSYDGVSGGFWSSSEARVVGVPEGSVGGEVLPTSALARLPGLAEQAQQTGQPQTAEWMAESDGYALVVQPEVGSLFALTLKHLPSIKDPAGQIRQLRIWALLLCALLAVGAVIWVALRLQRDAAALNAGLSRMEQDLNFRVAPIPGEFGAIAAAVNRMADRREGLESALRRQDRLAALGRVVAGVAHEIRNPLNSLRLTLELMKRRAGHGAVAAEQAEAAVNEVDRLDAILSRFLAFGRHELSSRQIQPVAPIVERVRRMASPAAEERGIRLEIRSPNSLPEADIDSLACEQVLLNLLLNAIEASPPATTVRLEAHAVEGWILLEVRDRGPGIAPSVREHIFDPYFTTKAEGAGLGLAVSRELVLRHEGVLDLDTGPDGSTFSVRLPLRRVV